MRSLDKIDANQDAIVKVVCDSELKNQLIRFGIAEGTKVEIAEKIPFGPLVIRFNAQEIAIGRELARQVMVE